MASDNDFYGQPNSYYTNLFSDYKKYIKEDTESTSHFCQ